MRLIIRKRDFEKYSGLIRRFHNCGWEIIVR